MSTTTVNAPTNSLFADFDTPEELWRVVAGISALRLRHGQMTIGFGGRYIHCVLTSAKDVDAVASAIGAARRGG